jgi:hypothetical protein
LTPVHVSPKNPQPIELNMSISALCLPFIFGSEVIITVIPGHGFGTKIVCDMCDIVFFLSKMMN